MAIYGLFLFRRITNGTWMLILQKPATKMDDEAMRYSCQWKIKSKRCLQPSDVIYEVETKRGKGLCQKHFEKFIELQEQKGDDKARESIGLKPRK